MIKKFGHLIFPLLFILYRLNAQTVQEQKVTVMVNGRTIAQVLEQLNTSDGINFSYQSNLRSLQKRIDLVMQMQPLNQVLSALLENTDLTYKFFENQVIIQTATVLLKKKFFIEGRVCISGTHDPVPYAGVELKWQHKGTIADHDGYFRFEVEEKYLSDTLHISSLNYDFLSIPARGLMDMGTHTIFLTPKMYHLPGIEVSDRSGNTDELGNHKWLRRGAIYVDTHGQQTALFMRNEKQVAGRIIRVSYYLSGKGNTNAPFRVRIYECDSLTGKPATDMLPEIVVVKPDQGKGWFHIDVSKYNLEVPRHGFFVAMEGVFPDDYDFYYQGTAQKDKTDTNDTGDDDFTNSGLWYGQQLGYTHANTNDTWHYAIDRTWFQLKKGHFNVMISAGIRMRGKKTKWRIINLFQRHEKDSDTHKSSMVD